MPNFEAFQRPTPSASTEPTMTITAHGLLRLNKPAVHLLNHTRGVHLLYDRAAKIIGIQPATDDADVFTLSILRDGGGAQISGKSFLDHYGINYDRARRRPAFLDDGVLCVDLTVEGTLVTSNRAGTV